MHWIAHYATYDRFETHDLDDSVPLVHNLKEFDNVNYLLSKREMTQMKNDYVILVVRVLVEFFQCMKPINSVIPTHIQHKYSKEMSNQSEIIMLPVSRSTRTNILISASIWNGCKNYLFK